jgi:hypothetical protein
MSQHGAYPLLLNLASRIFYSIQKAKLHVLDDLSWNQDEEGAEPRDIQPSLLST